MQVKAIVFPEPGKIELRNFELPPCGPDDVIAETIFTFVSPGTELRVLSGAKESQGKFPLIPGYSWVGRIIEVGSNLKGWSVGELVTGRNPYPIPGVGFLWGGQASHHRCPVKGYDAVLKLPLGADPWDYIITEVSAISWRGVSAAFPAPNETAVVIGQGLIGAFNARWLQLHGARVIVVDLEESRLERARKWGVCAALNGRDPDIRARILAHCEDGANIVVESSASTAGAALATTLLKQPPARRLNGSYNVAELHANAHVWPRLVFQATYAQKIETAPSGVGGAEGVLILKPGDRTVEDRLAVLEHIRSGFLNVADFLDRPTPVAEAPRAYLELRDHPDRVSAVAYDWRNA